jgi:shikimate kinase
MKIYLVGMPGSGKTTLGHKLAMELALKFVDLDAEIETYDGHSIPEIFIGKGESYFREIESRLLTEWAGSPESFVMATGGGAPCFFRGMEVINKTGLSIFLNVPVNELLQRVKEKTNRPLLDDEDQDREQTLIRLLETRRPCYRQAQITLTNPDLNKLMEAIHFKR